MKVHINFKDFIGVSATIFTIIWLILQITNYFSSKSDYSAIATKRFFNYEISPNQRINVENVSSLITSLRTSLNEDIINRYAMNSTINSLVYKLNLSLERNYNEMSFFTISNSGRSLENLRLRLNSSGYYKMILVSDNNNVIGSGYFSNEIWIGRLHRRDEIRIICWGYSHNSPREPVFIHEGGEIPIEYPWQSSNSFLIFFLIVWVIGCALYLIKNNNTNKNRIKIIDAISKYEKARINAVYEYNVEQINSGNLDNQQVYVVDIDFDSQAKSYDNTLWRFWDWGYKNILPKEAYEKIKHYIE